MKNNCSSGLLRSFVFSASMALSGVAAAAEVQTRVVQGPAPGDSNNAHTSINSRVDIGANGRLVACYLHTPARNTDPESLAGYAYSDDGGQTWTTGILPSANLDRFGPMDIEYDPLSGNWYILGSIADFSGTAGGLLWISTDNGAAFTQGANWMANDPSPGPRFYPKIAIDKSPASAHEGNIYILTTSGGATSPALVYRSLDGGASFGAPATLDPPPGGNAAGPAAHTILADGTVLIVGHGSTDLYTVSSFNGGQTFTVPTNMGLSISQNSFGFSGALGAQTGQPTLAQSRLNGTVYCFFTDPNSVDSGEIAYTVSVNGGTDWTAKSVLFENDGGQNTIQWGPDVVAHPDGGLLLTYFSSNNERGRNYFRRGARVVAETPDAGSFSI